MEYNIQKYNFFQNGKDYVVSTGLVGDKIRITCQENLSLDGPFYCNEFSLYDLRAANQFFRLTQSPNEALSEINKGIERQKSALKPGINDTMHFIGYLVIGTDNDIYNLILKRDFDPNRYGIFTPPRTNAADLVLTTNYHVNGERLVMAEKCAGDLQREQTFIEEELNRTIPEINRLKKITIDIEEENALIKERLKILQKQLEQRKYNVIRLKEENLNLKRENLNLNNNIKNKENSIRNKQAIQTNVKVQERPNINPGTSAVTSKFEQPALRTYLSRTGAKPTTEEYTQNVTYTTTVPVPQTQIITNANAIDNIQTQYLTPAYQEKQIIQPIVIQPQPIIYKVEQPIVNVNPQKQLRTSNYSVNSFNSYKTPTYRAYLSTNSKNVDYKNKLGDPNYYKSISRNQNANKDIPYSSGMANINNNKDMPYSSSGTANKNKDIPYTSSGTANKNYNNDVPYSSGMGQTKLNLLSEKIKYKPNSNNNSNNVGYNSQMAKTQGSNANYSKPVGSRMPQANLGNYDGKLYGSNKNNSTKKDIGNSETKDSLIIGFSSYEPEKK